jgi:LmbE family N-acetylglucosaminyl deacetylase
MLKVMSIMAHQDDFEFNAGGLFAKLRKHYGSSLKLKILTTTRGASGHHQMSLEETFRCREKEAQASAGIIGAEYECLKCLNGSHLAGQVFIDRNLLGGLWNVVRNFEPDIIFCPPVISDPLAGIHIDHYNTAWALRMVIYQLIVPNAYPTINGTVKMRVKSPVVINVDDSYAVGGEYDFALDISDVYEKKLAMALCHRSQIFEWLPWSSGEDKPLSENKFKARFRERHESVNKRYGKGLKKPREYFRITRWGKIIDLKQVADIIPQIEF